jgi:S1-C subfamily serine protease
VSAGLLPKSARSEDNPSASSPPPATDSPKPKQLSAAQQLEHIAVLLRTEDNQKRQFSGTGFLYNFFRNGDQNVTAIVTNRHVLAGMTKIQMRWTRRTPSNEPDFGKFIDVTLENLQERIIVHPDQDVDLAIIAVSDLLNKYQNESRPIYTVGADESLVASKENLKKFQPLEDILVVGYPDGISDTENNIPIFRRGVTATPVYMNFNGKKQFMIGAAIYHGSSGSPVFLYNIGAWIEENGHAQLGTRVGLLGVVYGVVESSTEGEIRVISAPTQFTSKVFSNIPHNLGACVPSYCILDFEPEIVKRGYKPPDGYKMRAQP